MRSFILQHYLVYVAAGAICLLIMLITDFILGSRAEHLNAWNILLYHLKTGDLPPASKTVKLVGWWWATIIVLAVNGLLGFILVQILRVLLRML